MDGNGPLPLLLFWCLVFGMIARALGRARRELAPPSPRALLDAARITLEATAHELGGTLHLDTRGAVLSANVEGVLVVARVRFGAGERAELALEATPGGPLPAGIAVRARDERRRSGVLTGDRRFDARFAPRGPEALVLSLLEARHRAALLGLEGKLSVEPEKLVWTAERAPSLLRSSIEHLARLARAWAGERRTVRERLAQMARHDPDPQVRLRVLVLMERDFGGAAETEQVRQAALQDRDPGVRLRAAAFAGAEGLPVLRAVLGSPETPAEVRGHGARLAPVGDPELEAGLISLLAHPELDVRLSAARSLGRLGTLAAVGALLEVSRGFLVDGELRSAARQSARRIQGRSGHAGRGQLSLLKTAPELGALSEAGDASGALAEAGGHARE